MFVLTSELSHWPLSLFPGPGRVESERAGVLMSPGADDAAETESGFGSGWRACRERSHQLYSAAD